MEKRLGIDIGRVIISAGDAAGDTSFLSGSVEDSLRTPASEGAFAAIQELCDAFSGRVWLVSKAGPRVQTKTRAWLKHHRFFVETGVPADHLRFCLERREKADHCRALAITHFIDDRRDVLEHLDGVVPHRFLFGPQRAPSPRSLVAVLDWDEALAAVLRAA
jgi:hypothetical protein